MIVLSYEVDDSTAQRYFGYAERHVRSMTEPMRRISRLVNLYVTMQFESEGDSMSGGWAELSEEYLKEKERHYPGMPILQRTRELMEDATADPFTGLLLGQRGGGGLRYGDGWLVYNPKSERTTDNGTIDLVEIHQTGREPDGERTYYMPARPIWETTEQFELGARREVADWLDELRGGRGPARNPAFDFGPVMAL